MAEPVDTIQLIIPQDQVGGAPKAPQLRLHDREAGTVTQDLGTASRNAVTCVPLQKCINLLLETISNEPSILPSALRVRQPPPLAQILLRSILTMACSWEGGRNTLSVLHTLNQILTDRQTERQTDRQMDVLTDDPLNLSDMLKQLVL